MCAIYLIVLLRLAIPFRLPVPAPERERHTEYVQTAVPSESETEASRHENAAAFPPPVKRAAPAPNPLPALYVAAALAVFLFRISSLLIFNFRIKKSLEFEGKYRKLKVFSSERLDGAVLVGFVFPKIILPAARLSPPEREIVLAHEYAHYKRGDIWRKLLSTVVLSLHFFNPFVYLMCAASDRAIEYACDEYVTKGRDINFRKEYSSIILKFIKRNGEK